MDSLISSQQLEITKWKTRATKLKENKREALKEEMPLSPHTPTKRRRPVTSEGHILDSPKSKFFDGRSVSESMSANCPKQFFDNSSLGNVPGRPCVSFILVLGGSVIQDGTSLPSGVPSECVKKCLLCLSEVLYPPTIPALGPPESPEIGN